MEQDRHKRIEELFQEVLDLPEGDRAAFLLARAPEASVREEVESLLAHYREAGSIDASPIRRRAEDDGFDRLAQTPERIGRYRILRKIGEGGMGIVYEGEQDAPRRTVAIKLIRPGMHPERRLRRFRMESELLARLQHPGIAHVYEAGIEDLGTGTLRAQVPYFVMEYIRGEPLHVHVRDRRIPPREILKLFVRVCDAVQYAHHKGIIHRDLKPANVLVDEHGNPKVLDFGVSRAVALDGEDERVDHTATGELLGTLPYMSPEQFSGAAEDVDTRSDVYALGVMLYELLTGRLPLEVQDLPILDAARRIARDPPIPASQVRPEIGSEIETILAKSLEKDPARRYSSPEDLARDLRRYLAGEPIEAKRGSRWYVLRTQMRRHRGPIAIAAAALVLLVASSAVAWMLYAAAERSRALATERLLDSYEAQARAGRSSRAIGRRFESIDALRRAAAIRPSLGIRNEALAALALSDLQLDGQLDVGAGRVVCQGLTRMDRCAIVEEVGPVRVVALPDGRDIARLTGPDGFLVVYARFSPGGDWLEMKYEREGKGIHWIWDVAGGRPVLRIGDAASAPGPGPVVEGSVSSSVAFSPSGSMPPWVALGFDDGVIRLFSLEDGTLWRTLRPKDRTFRLAADPSGRWLAASSMASSTIEIWDLREGRVVRAIDAGAIPYVLAFSPDGTRIAAGCSDFRARVFGIDGTGDHEAAVTGAAGREAAVLAVLVGHQAAVVDVGFVNERILASSGWDSTVRLWDLPSSDEMIQPLYGRFFAGAGEDRIALQEPSRGLQVYRFTEEEGVRLLLSPDEIGPVARIQFMPDGRHLISAAAHGVRLWDRSAGSSVSLMRETSRAFLSMPERGLLIASTVRGLLAWRHDPSRPQDLASASPSLLWSGTALMHVDQGPDGAALVVADRGERVLLVDTDRGSVLRAFPGHRGLATACMSPDGRWLFLGSWKGEASRLVDAQTGGDIRTFPGPHVRGVFSTDGGYLLVTIAAEASLLKTGTWEEALRIPLAPKTTDLAGLGVFRPDGKVLAVTPNRFQVDLVAVADGRALATLPNPTYSAIQDLAFSSDGQLLAGISPGREILIWDLARMHEALSALGLAWEE